MLGVLLYRLDTLNKTVKKSANEKDILLREIHHRVKNNLQVISALLTLQASHLTDLKAKEALKLGQDRVQSMAIIHRNLYQHDNLKGVSTKEYFEHLIQNLFESYLIDDEKIELLLDIQDLTLDVDTMIPLGLLVNELISNALKHAFTNRDHGQLEVSLHELNDQLYLSIKDNGIGVADPFTIQEKSFGYSLVQSFSRRLDADLNIQSKNGLEVEVLIKNYQRA